MEREGGDGERGSDVLGELHAWQGGNLEQSR